MRGSDFLFPAFVMVPKSKLLPLSQFHSIISGRTDGPTDGQMDGRKDGQKDGRIDGRTNIPFYRDARMHIKRPDRRNSMRLAGSALPTFGRKDIQTDGRTHQKIDRDTMSFVIYRRNKRAVVV